MAEATVDPDVGLAARGLADRSGFNKFFRDFAGFEF
jgi:hypothetical protein